MRQMKTFEQLRDSRLLFDKKVPSFGYVFLLIITCFITGAVIWSIHTPKIYTIIANGIITSSDSNYVMSTYSGEIEECHMIEGQLVEKGEVLFSIKSNDLDLQQKQLEDNRLIYEKVIAQNNRLVSSIKANTNLFDPADAEDVLYYSSYEAYKAQVAQAEFDTNTYKAYGYTDEQIVSELEKNQGKISEIYYSAIRTAENAIQEAEFQIAAIDAQLLALDAGTSDYVIRASASGTLHLLADYKEGMVVQAASTIATITPERSNNIIEAYVSTADMARIQKGDRVQIAVNGLSESVYGNVEGIVTQIDSNVTVRESSDGTSGSFFELRIEPEVTYMVSRSGDKVDLVNGMGVEARIEYDKENYFQYVMEKLGFRIN